MIADTWTDAVVVLHDGRIVFESYFNGMRGDPHLLMSVTKSVVGCVAGILVEQGLLDPDQPATAYVPEVAGSGYDGATVRHLLDMRTGVAFREEYTNPRRRGPRDGTTHGLAARWDDDQPRGMYFYLASLGTKTITADRSCTAPPTPTCSAGCVSALRAHVWPI